MRPVRITFGNFFKVLSKSLKRFRSSFDIVQFSRSCLLSRSSLFIISGKREFVKHFFDFSLSRSVEPLSFVTALLYYHAFHPLSTLFFNFLGIITEMLVFRALEEALVAIQWRNPNCGSLLQLCFHFIIVLYIIYEREHIQQSK